MIRTVAIIGAGNMGSGIAQKSSTEGFSVQMVDREQQWVDKGHATIEMFLQEAIERRIFRPEQAEMIKSNITGVVGHQNVLPDTDLVIEAVFEDFSLKQEIFSSLDSTCDKNTILATNTSSLSVNELSQQVGRKDKFLGIHWFYHPAKNRLVELIPAESTSQETLDAVEQYCKTMGKVIIFCEDRPGFCCNRFFVPWINEAARLKEEGIANAEQIDAVTCKAFRIGLGPFGLMNLTGPTIALHASDYLSDQLSVPRFRGADNMRELVERGGRWNIGEDPDCDEGAAEIIKDRLMGQAFAVCSQIVEEGICSMEDVDRAAKVGLRWSIGPFELANRIGVNEASRMAMEYAELAGIEIPDWFVNRLQPFDFSYVDVSVDEGIATVLINKPESMNALNVTVMSQLGEAIESLNARNDVNTIVLEGAGKAFVAGADVKFFVDMISQDNFQRLYDFTADGHKVLNSIESSPHTTIALATGLALGGGLELALSCDYRIGTERSMLRFPETSIGIFPALGGTQRTTRICGIEAARFAILGGNFLDPGTAKALGLLTHLVSAAEVKGTISEISSVGKPDEKYPGRPSDTSHPVAAFSASFYSDSNIAAISSGSVPDGLDPEDPNVARQMKALSRAAPLALKTASHLLEQAILTGDDLSAGLQLELDQLEPTFDSKDAVEGLSALIEGRSAEYIGS
jgi:enoyl-CoA hydratase/3-hydroxyacyl-CoA dehydrogenase